MGYRGHQRFAGGQGAQVVEGEAVGGFNQVVVTRVAEGKGQDALFFQVALVDTRKAAGNHHAAAQPAGAHGGVLAGTSFAHVLVAHKHPALAGGFIYPGLFGGGYLFAVGAGHFAGRTGEGIHHTQIHVVGDVIQMPPILQPRPGGRDMVGGALAFGFHQQRQAGVVLAIPGVKRVQNLQAVAAGVHVYSGLFATFGPRITFRVGHKALGGHFRHRTGLLQGKGSAILARDRRRERVHI